MRLVTTTILAALLAAQNVIAADNAQNEFYDSLLISQEYSKFDEGDEASKDARAKLQERRNLINVNNDRKLKELIKKQQQDSKKQARIKQNLERISKLPAAPFGLLWGETYEETLSSGVTLTRTEEKDFVNSFIATQLPKPIKTMRYVVVTFGEENKLWRIISYGEFIKDTPDAAKILKEYRHFYDMLNQKYGHAEQTYVPKITQVTQTVDLGHGKTKQEIENVEEPIGNPNFLSQLQNGEADLFASFYNNEVGAALSVNVDGNGNSYLILEYKNLNIFQAQQDKTLDAL